MKPLLQTLTGILLGLIFSGILLIVIRSPHGESITLAPSPTKAPVTVHISGAVEKTGVYSLTEGSRVIDLVNAAGGFSHGANEDSVNLAEVLSDESYILIRYLTDDQTTVIENETSLDTDVSTLSPININTATAEELEELPGIGPAKAEQIIDYRNSYGKFYLIEDIMNVPGIGTSLFEAIADLIVVK